MSAVSRHVFVSYAHSDAAWLERLRVHLRPVVRENNLDLWDDSRIEPGQDWREEIEGALARAHVAILLISADFLASDFIVDNELPSLMHAAAHRGLLILPLIVSPCLFSEHPGLSRYQTVNSPGRPLSGLSHTESERVLVSLGLSIAKYCRLLAQPSSVSEDPLAVQRPLNLGFDGPLNDGVPLGWFNSFGHVSGVSTDYAISTVQRSADQTAGNCAVLEKPHATRGEFGSLMQRCPLRYLAGQTARLEAELKTENVAGWAGLWIRADAESQPNVFFDNMSARPVRATTAWARYFIDAPLPASTTWLNYGVVLAGTGTVYVDNVRLLIWSRDGQWTDI
jgi:hypothetical protein